MSLKALHAVEGLAAIPAVAFRFAVLYWRLILEMYAEAAGIREGCRAIVAFELGRTFCEWRATNSSMLLEADFRQELFWAVRALEDVTFLAR